MTSDNKEKIIRKGIGKDNHKKAGRLFEMQSARFYYCDMDDYFITRLPPTI